MTRVIYQLTEKNLAKCTPQGRRAQDRRDKADENKVKLGRKYGLECRAAARDALKADPEYQRGLWQGRIDAANDLNYHEERLEKAYNMGYHAGYTGYESDLNGGLVIPSQYLINEVK